MNIQAFAAQLEVIKWRDEQLEAVTAQFRKNLPDLLSEISDLLDASGPIKSVVLSLGMQRSIKKVVASWREEQTAIAMDRAETALDIAIADFKSDVEIEGGGAEILLSGLTTAAGLTAMAGSVAAIPALIVGATVTTGGVLGFFTTTTISAPLVGIGVIGLGTVMATGSTLLLKTYAKTKEQLKRRLNRSVQKHVMGYGKHPGTPSVLSHVQAMIMQAGKTKIENLQ